MKSIVLLATIAFAMAQGGMVGGWTNRSIHDKDVHNISTYAVGVISDRANSYLHKKLVHVHEASSQVVAGIKYRIVLDMGSSVCRKNEATSPEERENCNLHKEMPIERCTVEIWERAWLNERQVLDFKCDHRASYEDYFSSENIQKDKEFHDKLEKDL